LAKGKGLGACILYRLRILNTALSRPHQYLASLDKIKLMAVKMFFHCLFPVI